MNGPISRAATSSVAFFGHLSGNFGLGMAARNTVRVMTSLGIRVVAADVTAEQPGGAIRRAPALAPLLRRISRREPRITLLHLNPPEVVALFLSSPWLARRDSMRAMVIYWELDLLRADWLPALECMDVVLTPTAFVDEAVAAAVPGLPRIRLPQAVFPPAHVLPDRSRWGLPDEATAFIFAFDVASDLARKNPMAVVEAFLLAFPGRPDVRLVVKAHGADPTSVRTALEIATPELVTDPRILLVVESLSFPDLMSLYASCDVYVSLHRSEGLGLGLMEAMSLGLPVIATGYSGPLDFLTPANSISVAFRQITVHSDNPAYAPMNGVTTWADPDLDDAAAAMRHLSDAPALRRAMGARAASDMEARREEVLRGEAFAALDNLLLTDDDVRRAHRQRQEAARALVGPRAARWRRGAVRHRTATWVKRRLRRGSDAPGP